MNDLDPRGGVKLSLVETSGNLPMVCMKCGEPATVWVEKEFHTHRFQPPSGIISLIIQFLSWASSPKMRVRRSQRGAPCQAASHLGESVGLAWLRLEGGGLRGPPLLAWPRSEDALPRSGASRRR